MLQKYHIVNSKYKRWYDQIIERAKNRALDDYKERHHILPRCLGGLDDEGNLVDLTYREHFLVHWLLTKIYSGNEQRRMIWALHAMTMAGERRPMVGWEIEVAKRALRNSAIKNQRLRKLQKTRLSNYTALKGYLERFEGWIARGHILTFPDIADGDAKAAEYLETVRRMVAAGPR